MASTPQVPRRSRQPRWVDWLLNLPNWLDQIMSWAGKWQIFWLVVLLLVLSIPLIITPLNIWQQGIASLVFITLSWLVVNSEQQQSRANTSQGLHLFLAWLSIVATFRYMYYRVVYTLNLDSWINGIFSLLLFAAELYAVATLLLSYFQTLRLAERRPVDLSTIPQEQWFSVDVYIPTYNEDVAIVRKTALAALALDYPDDKKVVYILDDGRKFPERRAQLQQLCDELGCILLTRDNNDHAKAGNINTALQRTDGDLILFLDCDHIPTQQFLKQTVGFFLNPKVSFVQTPHWFYNPDPFERNLLTQGRVPVNNELFYKIIQRGNDFWNAAFFCGSAAVMRRSHLLEVGGIATATVTEDCHTSLLLHGRGYESIYYDKIMVAGLAPEKFSSYVGQQVRWARGMAQVVRLENPLLNRKLKLSIPQRLCYFSATTHFFFGFPRLMYALAPTLFLLAGINLVRGLGVETLVYALPHIVLGLHANYITNKTARFSFWNEIFEYAMAFQDGIVTMLAIINPRLGKFNVTDKGVSVTKRSFDWASTRVSVFLTILLVCSLLALPFWLALRPEETEPALINAFWALFNLIFLVGAVLVALEQPQLRRAHRLDRQLRTTLYLSQHQVMVGRTLDISESGARLLIDQPLPNLPDLVEIEITGDSADRVRLHGKITRIDRIDDHRSLMAIDFVDVTPEQYDDLVLVLYSDVDQWYVQQRNEIDHPWHSLRFVATGVFRAFREPKPAPSGKIRKRVQADAQFFWEGQYYPARVVAISSETARLETDAQTLTILDTSRRTHLPIGLLIHQHADDPDPVRLLGQIEAIEASDSTLATSSPSSLPSPTQSALYPTRPGGSIAVELSFPRELSQQQSDRIRQLLRVLE